MSHPPGGWLEPIPTGVMVNGQWRGDFVGYGPGGVMGPVGGVPVEVEFYSGSPRVRVQMPTYSFLRDLLPNEVPALWVDYPPTPGDSTT